MSGLGLRRAESNGVESVAQPGQVFVRSQSVVSRHIGGETLIVPVRGKVGDLASIYSFNEIGSLLWRLLEIPRNLSELLAAVEREYDVDSETARQDVERFLGDVHSAGLVEVRPAAAAEPAGSG
jgi:hypothetical protein